MHRTTIGQMDKEVDKSAILLNVSDWTLIEKLSNATIGHDVERCLMHTSKLFNFSYLIVGQLVLDKNMQSLDKSPPLFRGGIVQTAIPKGRVY